MLKEGTRRGKERQLCGSGHFRLLADKGNIEEEMMYNTYNMGLGMILAVDPADVDKAMEAIRSAEEIPYVVGSIEAEIRERLYAESRCAGSGGGTNLQAILDAIDGEAVLRAPR